MRYSLKLPRWNEVLIQIYNCKESNRYCQKLNRKVKGSMTYLRKIINQLEENRLIEIKPTSKIKNIILTEKGEKIANSILMIMEELNRQIPESSQINQNET